MHVYTLEGEKNSGDVEAPIILLLSDDQVQNCPEEVGLYESPGSFESETPERSRTFRVYQR